MPYALDILYLRIMADSTRNMPMVHLMSTTELATLLAFRAHWMLLLFFTSVFSPVLREATLSALPPLQVTADSPLMCRVFEERTESRLSIQPF